MQIFVKALTGETITLDVKPTDNIEVIKPQIENEIGIHQGESRIIFKGEELGIDCLKNYGVEEGSILFVIKRLPLTPMREVYVRYGWFGYTTYCVYDTDTINIIKSRACLDFNLPPNQYSLLRREKKLDEGIMIYTLDDGDIITLDLVKDIDLYPFKNILGRKRKLKKKILV